MTKHRAESTTQSADEHSGPRTSVTKRATHLLTVWNPLYARNVDQHFALLLEWAKRFDASEVDDDDLYVWWGKVRSPNRQQPLARAADLRSIGALLESDEAHETHLYMTDYRSLYVGELIGILEGQLPASEGPHVPAYYREGAFTCDFWFKLGDIRRLVTDDLPAVAEELAKLRNVHYHDKPVSLYGGMVDLPLVVTRPDDIDFFDADERDAVAGDRLWVEYDHEFGGGTSAVERDLRENVLGERVWSALLTTARRFVADAERMFRDHRNEPGYDFAPVLLGFAKALELQCNAVLRRAAVKLPLRDRSVNIDGRSIDLANVRTLTLGQLVHAIGGNRELNAGLMRVLENGGWFSGQLPSILDALREERNPAAHESSIDRVTAVKWRNQLIGIGSKGHFVDLAEVRVRA